MAHLSTLCNASPFNNENILSNIHGSHFDDCTFHFIYTQIIKPFSLKSGDSDNHQHKTIGPMKNWRPFTTKPRDYGFWSMVSQNLHLTKWMWYCWSHGTHWICPTEISSVTDFRNTYPHPSRLFHQNLDMHWTHKSILWIQDLIHQCYNTPHFHTPQSTGNID